MAPLTGKLKLENLRKLMSSVLVNGQKGIQAYIVTSDDAHQSEYIQARDERRAWISGFKGSYGTALVTLDKALLWTDGRYFTQAALEFDPPEAWTLMKDGVLGTPSLETWLTDNLPANSRVGVDPHLISNSSWSHIQNGLSSAGHTLEPIENNLIDEIWGDDQPPRALNEIVPHKICYSGRKASEKVRECFEAMEKNKASVLVVTALDEIAYLLNWRGSDIPYNPVFFAYAVLYAKQVHIFVDDGRLNPEAKEQLRAESVDFVIHPYLEIRLFLKQICSASNNINKVWVSNNSSYALHSDCKSVPTHTSITPVMLMKLIKNEIEIQGMKNAHIRDGVALVKYYSWLESKVNDQTDSLVTEISGANQLEEFRREQDLYVGPSFSTISSSGAHGAIIHYKPAPSTDIPITNKEIYLCDAGAQFLDGTTDVTRTFHFGEPSAFEKECYTRVFKGQCNLSMTKFPSKTVGNYLDTLARKHLWDVGLNYLHGTGHGVGSYLNVHEFPAMISWRAYPDDPGLQSGMFLSNEPGYYEDGKFGIRLENIEMIKNSDTKYNRLNNQFLQFETVTMVPIQTRLLDMSMLTDDEVQYLNDYHSKCYEALKDHLQGPQNIQALNWLKKETQPIAKG